MTRRADPLVLDRRTLWRPAYDKRAEGYGQHCMDLEFGVRGPRGGASLLIVTGWVLPGREWASDGPSGAGIETHSPKPQYPDWQTAPTSDDCWYAGGACYMDGSVLYSDRVLARFIAEGEDAVWDELTRWYKETLP